MVANVEGLVVVVGILVINKSDTVLLGIVDDIGQQQIIVAEHDRTAHTTKLSLQQCIFFLQSALWRDQLQEPEKMVS